MAIKKKEKPKLPMGLYWRGGVIWIRYKFKGKLIRESTGQTSIKLAEQIRNKRKTEVAEGFHFKNRQFEKVTFGDLLNYWWNTHAKFKPSKFEYLMPRLERFKKMKATSITSDVVRDFLDELREKEELSASSVNHYRTIMNSVFNHAIRNKKYDENPVKAIRTFTEPPGCDRFTTPEEILKFFEKCDELGEQELKTFVIVAATTGLRNGSILPRQYLEVFLDDKIPYIYVGRTKNGDPIKIPLPEIAIKAIKALPSYGNNEYLFPAKPNIKYQGNFKKLHAWDFGKPFRRVCKLAGIKNLRIHDLRHFATTVLFMKGIPDSMIAKMTGHRSRELERYKHLSPEFKKQTVELIANELQSGFEGSTNSSTVIVSDLVQ
ncbi:MAG TPA: tyrosine-type recombinase/integrase [Blastocatellia bacterium]|jgi:integrase